MSDLSSGPSLGGVLQFSNHGMLLRNVLLISSSHFTSSLYHAMMSRDRREAVSRLTGCQEMFLPLLVFWY